MNQPRFRNSLPGASARSGPYSLRALALAAMLLTAVANQAFAQVAGSGIDPNIQFSVGPNYHATTGDFYTGFVRRYNTGSIRSTVLAQLQEMANSGTTVIKTTLWHVGPPAEDWHLSLPLADQELANIEQYVRDVASIRRPDGGHLDLQIAMAYIGCVDYVNGSASTTIGCNLPWATFISQAKTSIANLTARIGPITRADGQKAVERLYMELEVMIGPKPNQDRFMLDLYPFFLEKTSQAGLKGSVYFLAVGEEEHVFDDAFVDFEYPILNRHKSLFWVYRSIDWMRTMGLPLPDRLDFSFYPKKQTRTYKQFVDRLMSDVQAVFPGYRVGVAETYYMSDAAARAELGRAFSESWLARGIPEDVTFWSTPYETTNAFGHPFDTAAYALKQPAGSVSSVSLSGLTASWNTNAPSATAALWLDLGGGNASLVACGKSGSAYVANAPVGAVLALYATPACNGATTRITGVRIATAQVTSSTPAPPSCTYSISPTGSGSLPAGSSGGSFSVTAGSGCAWSASSGQSWIRTTSSGSGNGVVLFTVDPNSGAARSGSITVGGRVYSVSQTAAACSYSLSTSSSGVLAATATSGSFSVLAGSGCTWTALSSSSWIRTTSSGTGNGPVTFTVDANSGAARAGSITVGGQTYAVSQSGTTCSYALNPTSSTLAPNGGNGSFTVTAGSWCAWTAASQNSWIRTSSSGNGNGTVTFTADPNSGPARSGSIVVGGQSYVVNQALAPQPADLISPAPSSTLTASAVTFRWTGGLGVSQYWLVIGSSPNSGDLYYADAGTQLSADVSGLPTDGRPIYVQLFSNINGNWQDRDYTLTAASVADSRKAELVSPGGGTTLTSDTVTFTWTGGSGVSRYWLYIGTDIAKWDILNRDMGTSLSTVVSGLPTDGRPLYVRLNSFMNGTWQSSDYVVTAATVVLAQKAELISPAAGSTVNSSTVNFTWTGGTAVTRYMLYVGNAVGAADLVNIDAGTSLSAVGANLPTDGRTLYVRLHSLIYGGWQYNDYTIRAAASATSRKADLISPAPGSTLTSSTVTFQWTGGSGAAQYWLHIGTAISRSDILSRDMLLNLSTVATGLPVDGRTLYVRLYTYVDGGWQFNDYTLTAASSGGGGSQKAELVSPAAGSTLTGTNVTFQWTGGTAASQFWLNIGSAPGTSDLVSQNAGTALSVNVNGLPADGRKLYVRLNSYVGGWLWNDYVLTAASAPAVQKAELISPAPGSKLTSSTVTFQWTGGVGVSQYNLRIGNSPGGTEFANRSVGTNLSVTVANLPSDDRPLYVRLRSLINGVWLYNDYVIYAR